MTTLAQIPRGRALANLPLEVRLELFSDRSGGQDACWLWQGYITPRGYGRAQRHGRATLAHRFAYETLRGSVPEGMVLDHLCHTRDGSCPGGDACLHRRCTNPAHMEPVTMRENVVRGRTSRPAQGSRSNASKTHCPQGHPYSVENTRYIKGVYRSCKECGRAHCRKNAQKYRAQARAHR